MKLDWDWNSVDEQGLLIPYPCLWCAVPTRSRLDGLTGSRVSERCEPWHFACFAETRAWDLAVVADGLAGGADSAEVSVSEAVALGQLWLGLANRLTRLNEEES